MEERKKWDERYLNVQIIEQNDGEGFVWFYVQTPKPPIAVIWQRDAVVKAFRIDDYEVNKSLVVATSVDHESYPPGQGGWTELVRATNYITASLVEPHPSGQGVLMTEIRSTDLNGNVPEAAVYQMSRWAPSMNYKVWNNRYKQLTA